MNYYILGDHIYPPPNYKPIFLSILKINIIDRIAVQPGFGYPYLFNMAPTVNDKFLMVISNSLTLTDRMNILVVSSTN